RCRRRRWRYHRTPASRRRRVEGRIDHGLGPSRRKQSGCRRPLARGDLVRLLKSPHTGLPGALLQNPARPKNTAWRCPADPHTTADEGGNMHTGTNSSPLPTMRRTLLIGLGAAALVFSPMQALADTAVPSEEAT